MSYDGTRYQVRLPWKELHATLSNNFDLSQRRLSGLLKRLKHDPEILQEYDTIIRNQIESNIVEVVEAPFSPTTSKVHYIPHHPVIRRDKTTSKLRIDFAGPLYIKDGNKVWICLYTCCVTRAVHLEVVPNMTTEAFLRSFKRFAARRGFPNRVLSDNGKTFKAAQRALVKLVAQPSVTQYFSDTHIKWTFNLEKAPWWRGMFERLVKSMKQCLKRVVGGAKLTLDELQTVVTEAEATLNSRPLSYVSTEDLDEPLTPSHLIVGRRLSSYPDPFVDDARDPDYEISSADLTRRMQYLNTILNHFWVRWRREYLLELRETHRYAHVQNSPRPLQLEMWYLCMTKIFHEPCGKLL